MSSILKRCLLDISHVDPTSQSDGGEDGPVSRTVSPQGETPHSAERDKQRMTVQISSRDYVNLRGAIWDFSDSQVDEEDFQQLHGLVSCGLSLTGIVFLKSFRLKSTDFRGVSASVRKMISSSTING